MNSIEASSTATVEIKQSKFIAHLVPISQFEGLQERLRIEHPKSRHVVYALRYLNAYDQIVENSSDDGEPKGSSGVPALNVLRGEEMINTAVLIVRYFGGTKLGIGGLVRAYTQATKEVIAASDIKRYEKLHILSYETSYSDVQRVEYLLEQVGIVETEKQFSTEVSWTITATQEKLDQFSGLAGRLLSCNV
jgi:uncharacterized YigZ family protein